MTKDLAGTAWTSHTRTSRLSHQLSVLYFSLPQFLEGTWYFCNLHFSVSHLRRVYTRPLLWKCSLTSRWKKELASQDVSIWAPKPNGHSWKFWLWKLYQGWERGGHKSTALFMQILVPVGDHPGTFWGWFLKQGRRFFKQSRNILLNSASVIEMGASSLWPLWSPSFAVLSQDPLEQVSPLQKVVEMCRAKWWGTGFDQTKLERLEKLFVPHFIRSLGWLGWYQWLHRHDLQN